MRVLQKLLKIMGYTETPSAKFF